jgi:eukaryotic-like serine/threonine-protein kinase
MLTVGARLGPYEVIGSIGAGGMGEVYRARDTKLNRDVALKVLPESLATDPDRLARFQREALLAALNHPHIAQIYGFEGRAIVMELVEGETLADRIERGPIPVKEALTIAKQIADALEAAHEQRIIHRDLKPANIKVRTDDTVKVLDFGLAKAMEPAGVAPNVSQSPTISTPAMTMAGVILGTAAYMSPEQAKGRPADKRSDIWAFGCVLFEMLTGTRAFDGEGISDTLASVLRADPEWSALPADTPSAIRRMLQRCLQKDPGLRLHDIADARLEIDDALHAPGTNGGPGPTRSRVDRVVLYCTACVVGLIAIGALAFVSRPIAAPAEMRVEIVTPSIVAGQFAISPDGRRLVYVARSQNRARLWLRSLQTGLAQPLSGSEDAALPFWSPDSRSVGFFAEGKLKRIDVDGGSVQVLADALFAGGGAWSRGGTILFNPNSGYGQLFRVPASGGAIAPATNLKPGSSGHTPIQFLADDRHFLFLSDESPRALYVGQLDSDPPQRLIVADWGAYLPSGQLLFVRQGVLFAQDFGPDTLSLAGNPTTIASGQVVNVNASATGTIAYRAGTPDQMSSAQFVWVDRGGNEIGKAGPIITPGAGVFNPSLSPDGRRLAFQNDPTSNVDIWLLDLTRGVLDRFTSDPAIEAFPIWSPDGQRVVFNFDQAVGRTTDRTSGARSELYQKAARGAGAQEVLFKNDQMKWPCDWSPDGRFVLYKTLDAKNADLWAVPLDGDMKPFPVAQTRFEERDGQFSPDGKWVAYESDESGRFEIYIQAFPGPGTRERISTDGGTQVRWRRDGKELFYVAADGRLMATPIHFGAPSSVEAGIPVPLFKTSLVREISLVRQQYVVSADGQRFLMKVVGEESSGSAPITLILNWAGHKQ